MEAQKRLDIMREMSRKGIIGFFLIGLFILVAQHVSGQNLYTTEGDRELFERYHLAMKPEKDSPMDQLMIKTALFFQDTPYVPSTLEKEPEGLVLNLRELDCTTFMETVLALCRTIQGEHPSFESFCNHLQMIRYREGSINDYTDRLHYMADWLYENERKGIVKDMSHELGGSLLSLDLSFISTHPDLYKPLVSHPEFVREIAVKEKEINARTYSYLSKEDLGKQSAGIRDGDILCFVTSIKGLDVTHVGIAYWQEERLTFIHASSSVKKVIVEPSSLQDYIYRTNGCKGIWITRPLSIH